MGMGTYASFAETVEEFVIEQCPEAFETLDIILEEEDISSDHFSLLYDENLGYDKGTDLNEEQEKKITKIYECLQMDFENKTGLVLKVRHHEKEDRGDEVNGGFWEVEGVYQLTPAGKKYEDKITRAFWTTWG